MTRPASLGTSRAPRAVLASVLCTGTLLVTAACSALELGTGDPRQDATTASSSPARTRPAKPSAPASAAAAPALTDAQAQAALISEADLGEPWVPTQGAATWRDAFLKVRGAQPDCGRLMEALYADELLGAPARAAVGLDDLWDEAQLRHQVTAQSPAEVDRALARLATLPQKCGRFRVTAERGGALDVTVDEVALPPAGDARQGLLVTVTAGGADDPVTLTLVAAAVRVGEDAFTVTGGGLGDVPPEAVDAAVQLGALRLAEVRRQGRVQV
ncbi:hypothetical protein [Streptomyces sp. NPDC093094]|uniref:hypothetical protein n=1 Tax=Streptomyces sp. NPDC093094 TaxID=3366026 RepID=UPI0038142C65